MSQTTILQPPALEIDAKLFPKGDMPGRCRVERRVVWNLLAHLQAAGFRPELVQNGDWDERTETPEAMMEEIFNLDEARLWFSKGPRTQVANCQRWVFLVLGNDGWDVINDWGIPRESDGFNEAMEAFNPEVYA